MERIIKSMANTKRKAGFAVIQLKNKAHEILSDTRGESQNTSSAGFVIVSILLIAIVITFVTGFAQNTIFPWVQNKFNSFTGKG